MMYDLNSNLSELIGAIIGDGLIRYKPDKNQYYVEIVGSIKDEQQYLIYLQKIINLELKVNSKISERCRGLRLRFYSKKFVEFLIFDLSMNYNKEKCLNISIPNKIFNNSTLLLPCLRGIVDTDGSLFLSNKSGKVYPIIEISTISSKLANQLREILSKSFRIGFRSYTPKNYNEIYRISLNGHLMVEKWFNLIGFSNFRNFQRFKKIKKMGRQGFEPWIQDSAPLVTPFT